jgi:hypothetical protein
MRRRRTPLGVLIILAACGASIARATIILDTHAAQSPPSAGGLPPVAFRGLSDGAFEGNRLEHQTILPFPESFVSSGRDLVLPSMARDASPAIHALVVVLPRVAAPVILTSPATPHDQLESLPAEHAPEPGSIALVGAGAVVLLARGRRTRVSSITLD